jgi:hypothetical protein
MLAVICAIVAIVIVATIVAVVLFDRASMSQLQSAGLLSIAGGLAWGGVERFLRLPPGAGDLLFLAGLLALLATLYWPRLFAKADAFDGRLDGRVHWRRF